MLGIAVEHAQEREIDLGFFALARADAHVVLRALEPRLERATRSTHRALLREHQAPDAATISLGSSASGRCTRHARSRQRLTSVLFRAAGLP